METTAAVKNLTKKFGDFTAADHLTFSVGKGEIFGFLGPNGAGKSTTIRMLCGIIRPTSGEGSVLGHDIIREQEKIRQSIGYMSQKFSLYDDLTVEENLSFYGSIYGIEGRDLARTIKRTLDEADLTQASRSIVKDLPAGIKQRLALGAATIHNPKILFLDEPTSGVDPAARRLFWEIIYGYAESGRTVFVTTHYMDEAEHCGRIALITAGKIIALDTPKNLKNGLAFDIYSLRTGDFISLFRAIQNEPFVQEAAIFGSEIHILTAKGSGNGKELRRKALELTRGSCSVEKILPSLEDVFVTSTRKFLK
jgi:ABC-2 type transport system ATP-binding protein